MIIHLFTARSNDKGHRKSYHDGHIYKLKSIKSQINNKGTISPSSGAKKAQKG